MLLLFKNFHAGYTDIFSRIISDDHYFFLKREACVLISNRLVEKKGYSRQQVYSSRVKSELTVSNLWTVSLLMVQTIENSVDLTKFIFN